MIYRILTELINNSIKHAPSSIIKIKMEENERSLSVLFEDNGYGFVVEKALQNSNGIGLQNVVSRVKSLNGTIHFDSQPDKGFKAKMDFFLQNLTEF